MRSFLRLSATLCTCLGGLLLLAPAGQAVTIGTQLDAAPVTNQGCEFVLLSPGLLPTPSCTFFAVNTQTPPGNHVVTAGRIRTGPRTGPMKFTAVQVMRSKATVGGTPGGAICCFGGAENQTFTPPPNSVVEVPMRLPMRNTVVVIDGEQVEVIDYLGISLLDLNSSAPIATAQAFTSYFVPALRPGAQGSAGALGNALGSGFLPLINGEFVRCPTGRGASISQAGCPGGGSRGGGGSPGGPAGDGGGGGASGFAVARRVPIVAGGTRARLIARIPSAGVLRVRPAPRFRRLVRPAARRVSRGVNLLAAGLTRAGQRAVNRSGRLRVTLIVTYRAQGASPSSLRRQATFRALRR